MALLGLQDLPAVAAQGLEAVAVATGANQVVASSVSGALTQWRRGNVDIKLGTVMLMGGVIGSTAGVSIVKALRASSASLRPYG